MINIHQLIEDYDGPEIKVFNDELEKLTDDQLAHLVAEERVYDLETALRTDRDFLEIGTAEVSWREFFFAYYKVTGTKFTLDK
jgi:hypothetical protein